MVVVSSNAPSQAATRLAAHPDAAHSRIARRARHARRALHWPRCAPHARPRRAPRAARRAPRHRTSAPHIAHYTPHARGRVQVAFIGCILYGNVKYASAVGQVS